MNRRDPASRRMVRCYGSCCGIRGQRLPPEPPLLFSVFSTPSCSYPAIGPGSPSAVYRVWEGFLNVDLCVGGPEPSLRGLGESPRAAPRCRDAGGEVRKNRMSIEWCVVRTLQRFGGRGDTSVTFCGFPLTSERRVCILLTQLNSEMNRISGGTVTSDEDSPLRHRVHPGDLRPVAGTDAFRASWCRRGDW